MKSENVFAIRFVFTNSIQLMLCLILLLIVFTSSSEARKSKNYIQNASFEKRQADGPVLWTISDKQKGKGDLEVRSEPGAFGKNVLALIPNSKNRVVEQPFGLLQQIPAENLAGHAIQFSASMYVEGQAEAAVVLFAMSEDQRILQQSILLSIATEQFKHYSTQADIPDEVKTIVIGCTTSSRKGVAFFDNLSLTLLNDEKK